VELANARAATIGQDQETSLVYGMPKAAAATGRLQHVVPLSRIPTMVARAIQGAPAASAAAK
jgi:two-component system chemotaxis response regulator CheB